MKKPQSKPESKQKMKVIKGIVRGEKSFTINPKDLERERKANEKALEEIAKNKSEKKEKTLNEKFEDSFKDAFKKSLKPASQIPKTAKDIPIELFIDKVKDTTKIIITEAKFKASEKKRKRPGPRERISKEKKAFDKWVIDNHIDLNKFSVNKLEIEIEVAFKGNKFPYKLSHSTLGDYLKDWKQKNHPG